MIFIEFSWFAETEYIYYTSNKFVSANFRQNAQKPNQISIFMIAHQRIYRNYLANFRYYDVDSAENFATGALFNNIIYINFK